MQLVALTTLFSLALATAPNIQLKTTDCIVIVGGGPAGVHYASLLAKKGFKKITLLEASGAVGGKSLTLTDDQNTAQDMGTILALETYTPIFDLANEYDPTNTKVPTLLSSPGYMNFMGESTGAQDTNPSMHLDFPHYLMRNILLSAPPSVQANPNATQLNNLFMEQAGRYLALHRSIFGSYPYGMPPPPKDWRLIDMTAIEFLRANNLTALIGLFRFTQQTQGYGVLETIPAFYFLWWSHPVAVTKILQGQVAGTPTAYMFKNGFQSIWQAIAKAHRNAVKTIVGAKVTRVSRGLKSGLKPSVTYTKGTSDLTIECDHIVMAVDLSVYASVVDDLTDNEKALFTTSYTASAYITTLFESTPSPAEAAILVWHYRMLQGGRVNVLRNSKLMTSYNGSVASWGDLTRACQTRVAYQFYDRPLSQVDQRATAASLWSDFRLAGLEDVGLYTTRPFNYFPRFTAEGLKAGLPWKIWDVQGQQHTTWVGSSVSFESVLDVVTYNNNLIQRLQIV
ncbi:Aste57867_3909 [Aphanomyces stellatus]|uniref:Aste57867_3909 protein n=1 Tax=Aphanomyces stellatus TaxID=120398 RepID=A0A485KEZ2_9STRA|nr:hypothetical protein As57867_003898 [Aphanomyces stellatus]VFT81048.1 Aste57867_3909 [Aphanomyces stellatus]